MANNHGGKRENAGRKSYLTRAQPTIPKGVMPIDFMLATMRGQKYVKGELVDDESISYAVRLDAGKAAAPFLYPRLSAIDSTLDLDGKLSIQIVKYADTDTA